MTSHTDLPIETTAFVGRESDIRELAHLITTARLVTLCGMGGIGKTRLALRVAREVEDRFPDGVRLVELADLEDPAMLAERFAASLRLPRRCGDVTENLLAALAGSRLLLVVDNCEHVVEECARMCARILAACEHVRLLATGREPLRVPGEYIWRVSPLTLPSAECPDSEAVRLFRDRAAAARPDVDWSGHDGDQVAALCAELEGVPLAIELAAAMTRYLSVRQIRARLGDRFHLLTGGDRTAPARHRTLLANVEWSYRMLSGPERLLLERLTVFSGGWTLEMAEMVCAGGGVWREEVLRLLAGLVDRSLVVVDGEIAGEARYRMLDTLRAYARERLVERGEEAELRRRHLGCVSELARAGSRLVTARADWPAVCRHLAMLDAMHLDVCDALRWAAETGEVEQGLRVLIDLRWQLIACGRFDALLPLFDRLLAASDGVPDRLLAEAMALRAELAFLSGDVVGGGRWAQEALARVGECCSPRVEVYALVQSVVAAPRVVSGEDDRIVRALALARRARDPYLECYTVYIKGVLAQWTGRFRDAVRCYEEVLTISRHIGELGVWSTALALVGLAGVAHERGDPSRALACYERAQELLRDEKGRVPCLAGMARIAIAVGGHIIAHRSGTAGAGASGGTEAVRRAANGTAALIALFAELAAKDGDHRRAVRLLGVREAIREAAPEATGSSSQGSCARVEKLLELARRELGEAVVARLWDEGRGLSRHHSIEFALAGSLASQSRCPLRASEPFPASAGPLPSAASAVPAAAPAAKAVAAGNAPLTEGRGPAEEARVPPLCPSMGGLTAREREIASLVARGLSNKGIADELVISHATVARHVANILAKLGFSSRTQIAAWVLRHALDRPEDTRAVAVTGRRSETETSLSAAAWSPSMGARPEHCR